MNILISDADDNSCVCNFELYSPKHNFSALCSNDWAILSLIYELNKDAIYEYMDIEATGVNTAMVMCIFKHKGKECGLKQKYSYYKITREVEYNEVLGCNCVRFVSKYDVGIMLPEKYREKISSKMDRTMIEEILIECNLIEPTKTQIQIRTSSMKKFMPVFVKNILHNIITRIIHNIQDFFINI